MTSKLPRIGINLGGKRGKSARAPSSMEMNLAFRSQFHMSVDEARETLLSDLSDWFQEEIHGGAAPSSLSLVRPVFRDTGANLRELKKDDMAATRIETAAREQILGASIEQIADYMLKRGRAIDRGSR